VFVTADLTNITQCIILLWKIKNILINMLKLLIWMNIKSKEKDLWLNCNLLLVHLLSIKEKD